MAEGPVHAVAVTNWASPRHLRLRCRLDGQCLRRCAGSGSIDGPDGRRRCERNGASGDGNHDLAQICRRIAHRSHATPALEIERVEPLEVFHQRIIASAQLITVPDSSLRERNLAEALCISRNAFTADRLQETPAGSVAASDRENAGQLGLVVGRKKRRRILSDQRARGT